MVFTFPALDVQQAQEQRFCRGVLGLLEVKERQVVEQQNKIGIIAPHVAFGDRQSPHEQRFSVGVMARLQFGRREFGERWCEILRRASRVRVYPRFGMENQLDCRAICSGGRKSR
jgi:hypothetical protein